MSAKYVVALLALVAIACTVSAREPLFNEEGVMIMGMGKNVHHETRKIVYQGRFGDDPLGGDVWPVAIYWVEIEVGTPPRKFPVAIDTGSYTLDIPDVGCQTCVSKKPNNVYDASQSSTSAKIDCGLECSLIGGGCAGSQCAFSNTYQTCDLKNPDAPCTIKGVWYKDQVTFGGASKAATVDFGTITYQTSNFNQFQNIDGVMGLAGPSGNTNTFEQLVSAGALPQNVFAMCFVEGKTSNGTITFGGLDSRLYIGSQINYVPDVGGSGFYAVQLEGISLAGKSISGTSYNQAILDSGTNVLLLPTPFFDAVRQAFEALCPAKLPGICNTTKSLFDGYCYDYTPEQLAVFPNMTLGLNGYDLHMQSRNYLLQGQKAGSVYCLGIRNTGNGGFLIIGDTTMENYYMVMDRASQRIGWAPVNRNNCGSL